jgi:mono/diheme cytochrome c family protein
MARFAVKMMSLLLTAAACVPTARGETPLERGTYLMRSIVACGNCHTQNTPQGPMPGMELAGGTRFDESFGTAYAPNITPDKETGIGNWSDAQIVAAIRDGRRPDGSIIGPPMPIALYRDIADEDARAIVAYLRAAAPVSNKVAKSAYKVPLPPAYGPPVTTVAAPPKSDKVKYGAYLAGPLGHCIECHSTPGPHGAPDFVNNLGAGGLEFHGPWGLSVGPNITPTALGGWSDDDVIKVIINGIRPDGRRILPPMAVGYYRNIAADDLDAIVAYLRALPPK